MKFSVITVCWNSVGTIRDAVESVFAQKGVELEYLVMDGGSTDGTVECLRALEAKCPPTCSFKWVSARDGGMYDALNKGIRKATGDVVGIVNADDALSADDVLARIAAGWKEVESRRGTIDATYGDIRFVRADVQGIDAMRGASTRRYCSGARFRPWMFRFGTQIAHPSFYCRRECFERLGGYLTDFGMYADFELLVRFLWRNRLRVAYLPICTTVMRMGGASTKNFAAIRKINVSDLKALKRNGYWSCLPLIYLKYICKIWGFVFRRNNPPLI